MTDPRPALTARTLPAASAERVARALVTFLAPPPPAPLAPSPAAARDAVRARAAAARGYLSALFARIDAADDPRRIAAADAAAAARAARIAAAARPPAAMVAPRAAAPLSPAAVRSATGRGETLPAVPCPVLDGWPIGDRGPAVSADGPWTYSGRATAGERRAHVETVAWCDGCGAIGADALAPSHDTGRPDACGPLRVVTIPARVDGPAADGATLRRHSPRMVAEVVSPDTERPRRRRPVLRYAVSGPAIDGAGPAPSSHGRGKGTVAPLVSPPLYATGRYPARVTAARTDRGAVVVRRMSPVWRMRAGHAAAAARREHAERIGHALGCSAACDCQRPPAVVARMVRGKVRGRTLPAPPCSTAARAPFPTTAGAATLPAAVLSAAVLDAAAVAPVVRRERAAGGADRRVTDAARIAAARPPRRSRGAIAAAARPVPRATVARASAAVLADAAAMLDAGRIG